MNNKSFQQIVLPAIASDGKLSREDVKMFETVFENFHDLYYYVKDTESRWISCNSASIALLNMSRIEDVLGASEVDFFPPKIAHAIRQDDLRVLKNGQPILNRIELIPNADGLLVWVSTNKQVISTVDGQFVGLIGTTALIANDEALPQQYEHFRDTISYIRANLSGPIKVIDLAEASGLSESQFRRRFGAQFGVSPQEFILRARLQAAARLLSRNDHPISTIASDCGFADQSYFNRQFKIFFHQTPNGYRAKWRSPQ